MRPNPQDATDLVIFTEEIPSEKLLFLCSVTFDQHGQFIHQYLKGEFLFKELPWK